MKSDLCLKIILYQAAFRHFTVHRTNKLNGPIFEEFLIRSCGPRQVWITLENAFHVCYQVLFPLIIRIKKTDVLSTSSTDPCISR